MKSFFENKQGNHYADEKIAFILVLGFSVITNFMQKAKSENNWKNKHLA